ncbi:MAG: TRAP transporter substrate-binding protein [Pseudomonadota bacterium]
MNIKRIGLSAVFAASVIFPAQVAGAEELTVATFVPPQHHTNTVLFSWFAEELETRSGGSLSMQLFPAGQLGAGPVQQYKRAVEGVADITFGVSAYTPALFPKTMLAIPPGKSESSAEATQRILAVFDEHLADEYEDVKVIALSTAAGIGIASTRDMSTLEAMDGAKMVPYAALTSPIIESMGAVPVQMPVTEMYTGLSTGTIDGAYATYNNMTPPWNFWDVASHFTVNVPVQHAVIFVVMNKERYMGLSDEHRAIIDDLSMEAASMKLAESFDGADAKSLAAMKATDGKNYELVTVSAEERARMDAAVADGMKVIFADYASRGIENAEEIYNAINK